MRLTTRLDALTRRLPAPPVVRDEDAPVRGLCEVLERYAPIPDGETYRDVDARLDAALDRLHTTGVGIPAGPSTSRIMRFAAVYGLSVRELKDSLRERAGYGVRCE